MSSPTTQDMSTATALDEKINSDTRQAMADASVPGAVNGANPPAVGVVEPVGTAEDAVALEPEAQSESGDTTDVSADIDQRRAKQLLDRAILLSERGDLAGAILAARQAVSLVPTEPSGHSMLGLLHERAGDLEKAIASYEKVLHLAPQSTLERDSLERLKATLESENSSVIFHFDDTELFEEPAALPSNAPVKSSNPMPPGRPVQAALPLTTSAAKATPTQSPAQVTQAAVKSAAASSLSGAAPAGSTGLNDPSKKTARPVAGPPDFGVFNLPLQSQKPSLGLLLKHPSFYFKGAPVIAVTTFGLLFMAWAQGVAQEKGLLELPPLPAKASTTLTPQGAATPPVEGGQPQVNGAQTTVVTAVNPGNPAAPTTPVVTGGGIFGGPGTPTTDAGRTATQPRTATSQRNVTSSGSTGGAQVAQPLAPAPVIPQPRVAEGGDSGNSFAMPRIRTTRAPEVVRPSLPVAPAPASPSAPVSVTENGTAAGTTTGTGSGNAGQGAFFNPSNAPRGYIRVDPVRPASPPSARPSNVGRAAENAASRAATTGRTTEVVPNLNRAIDRAPTGYAYQRRAMAFMEQGDYSRAADDFQSAIAGFEDQIRRGQNEEDARNGIRACRSGLQLALENARR